MAEKMSFVQYILNGRDVVDTSEISPTKKRLIKDVLLIRSRLDEALSNFHDIHYHNWLRFSYAVYRMNREYYQSLHREIRELVNG